ncbi:beta-ketoacyl-ACP synthase III [Amycolatopsis benzoatilytica]|uniref:beta-ketoacyl-ACP synthase III n=1 Tax=Amycolatopsis benzoatilytica TaxID=346045 RepID=UPI000382F337|nr:beta-ketoacyl-ACP synthase III [Amycolatopsis benzoatilytica]
MSAAGRSPHRAAVVAGLGGALPETVVTNHEIAARLDTSDEWIRTRTGIRERRRVAPGQSTVDLAEEAGRAALGGESADAVVLATSTPGQLCPATAPQVAARLGLGTALALDVNAVCSGFIYALATAAGFISGGIASRVLVIGADVFTSLIDPDDRTTVPIFGDGAGALLLRAGEPEERGALGPFDLHSEGELAKLLWVEAGGATQRLPEDPKDRFLVMQGTAVFRQACARMAESSRAVLEQAGWMVGDVDRFVGHQANIRILQATAKQLGMPTDTVVSNIDRVGNTSAASIPLALADAAADGSLMPGHRVLLTAFGAGLTWGSTVLTWPDVPVPAAAG